MASTAGLSLASSDKTCEHERVDWWKHEYGRDMFVHLQAKRSIYCFSGIPLPLKTLEIFAEIQCSFSQLEISVEGLMT